MVKQPTGWNFVCRPGGWMRAKHIRDGRVVYLRVGRNGDGRLVVQETHIGHTDAAPARVWVDLPFKDAESVARRPHITRVLEMPAEDGAPSWPGNPDPYFAHRNDDTYYSALVATLEAVPESERPESDRPKRPEPLGTPPRPLTDEFLSAVADHYRYLTYLKERRPAAVIAENTGAPTRTVQGWVAAARKRGLLAPALGTTAG